MDPLDLTYIDLIAYKNKNIHINLLKIKQEQLKEVGAVGEFKG